MTWSAACSPLPTSPLKSEPICHGPNLSALQPTRRTAIPKSHALTSTLNDDASCPKKRTLASTCVGLSHPRCLGALRTCANQGYRRQFAIWPQSMAGHLHPPTPKARTINRILIMPRSKVTSLGTPKVKGSLSLKFTNYVPLADGSSMIRFFPQAEVSSNFAQTNMTSHKIRYQKHHRQKTNIFHLRVSISAHKYA